jgi:hypothetical protein
VKKVKKSNGSGTVAQNYVSIAGRTVGGSKAEREAAAKVYTRAEVWRVLATAPASEYWLKDLPALFKAADSWLLVEFGHSARTLGKLMVKNGLYKETRRTRKDGKRTWAVCFVDTKK